MRTALAVAIMFDNRMVDYKTSRSVRRGGGAMALFDRTAITTDIEFSIAFIVTMSTGDKGIECLNFMGQSGIHKKVQSPVDGWWFGFVAGLIKLSEKIVGLDRAFGLQQQLKHVPT